MTQPHQLLANSLLLLMLLLGLWGVLLGLLGRAPSGGYRSTYVLSIAVFGVQDLLGLVLLVTGHRPPDSLHYIYGIAPVLALGGALLYGSGMKPRRESFTLGLAALFTFGLIIRAFTTGR